MYKIYALVDPRTNQIRYVGVTIRDIEVRRYHHLWTAKTGYDTHCYRWIRQLLAQGIEPSVLLLEATNDRDREKWWIKVLREQGTSLTNETEGGDGGAPMKGRHHTEDTKRRLSIKNRNNPKLTSWSPSGEIRQIISDKAKARWKNPEYRDKMASHMAQLAEAKRGKKRSPETVQRMSIGRKGKGGRKGWTHTAEAREKLREARIGKTNSEQTRKKISESNRGRAVSEETRQKISKAHKTRIRPEEEIERLRQRMKGNKFSSGRPCSEETRRKISEANRGRPKKKRGDGQCQ